MNTPKPEHTPDEKIAALCGDTEWKQAEAIVKAMNRVDELMRPKVNAETVFHDKRAEKPVINLRRAYDLHFDLQTAAPRDEQWSCIDLNTYDASEGIAAIIGRGPDRKSAMLDCLEQFGEFDEPVEPLTPDSQLAVEEQVNEDILNGR